MNLLVHACCGPCSIMPTRLLADQGHDITVFYANSNITPRAEYDKRLHELQRYAAEQGICVFEGKYDPVAWEREVAPIGEALKSFSPAFGSRHVGEGVGEKQGAIPGDDSSAVVGVAAGGGLAPKTVAELLDDENRRERCRACYRLRLNEAAAVAAEGGFEGLATTLAVSPYQFTDVIREELESACAHVGIKPHFEDYRPYYDEATRISRELGMYRQSYCGCRYSVVEGEATRAFIKRQRAEAKEARAQARAAENDAQEAARRNAAAKRRAYESERARRRAILKELRNQSKRS